MIQFDVYRATVFNTPGPSHVKVITFDIREDAEAYRDKYFDSVLRTGWVLYVHERKNA